MFEWFTLQCWSSLCYIQYVNNCIMVAAFLTIIGGKSWLCQGYFSTDPGFFCMRRLVVPLSFIPPLNKIIFLKTEPADIPYTTDCISCIVGLPSWLSNLIRLAGTVHCVSPLHKVLGFIKSI